MQELYELLLVVVILSDRFDMRSKFGLRVKNWSIGRH